MKVIHVCLSCFYIDNSSYQENELVKRHVEKGHDVVVLASTESYDDKGKLCYVKEGTYLGSDGAKVVRLPYRSFLPHKIMRKLRFYKGAVKVLKNEAPDVLVFHGLCAGELISIVSYVKKNKKVRFFIDSHEDFNNSAMSFGSKYLLHLLYYRTILKIVEKHLPTILCVSIETMSFVSEMYGISKDKLEFFPMGGAILNEEEIGKYNTVVRNKLGIKDKNLVLLHSGKFNHRKRIIESLKAFKEIKDDDAVLLIAGMPLPDVEDEFKLCLSQDKRIKFLGWLNREELIEILCAVDIYLQPGTQSATMQQAMCCGCAVLVRDMPSHEPFIKGNGWLVGDDDDLVEMYRHILIKNNNLELMKKKSYNLAMNMLDYSKLAERIL
ncbi:MAG: glycosyl transferase family 1 [Halobacteriovoraceae bacterium]|nr:glycosyl transferase family 1 [Halobacteriovoraceae bacterium]|tara:strand:+ start:7894 stop:9036 length:1143 start_codon:yes stop_codon:yes gene_type:complete